MGNSFTIPAGDVAVGGTFTIQQLRSQYVDNGGFLTPRHRQFLRRFVPPYVSEKPIVISTTQFVIILPKDKILEKAPPSIIDLLKPFFEVIDDVSWYTDRPWLGASAFLVSDAQFDAEFGPELPAKDNNLWEGANDLSGSI